MAVPAALAGTWEDRPRGFPHPEREMRPSGPALGSALRGSCAEKEDFSDSWRHLPQGPRVSP